MMVTFVSQCEKNALKKTRRVLDAFANRIGDNTWQTVITEDGLLTVKKMLRRTASKNTAVSCHWIRSRSRSQFLWVVGNKRKFDGEGRVPVNATAVNRVYRDDHNDWKLLPLIRALACMSALLHDWGKANERFQKKLGREYKGSPSDPLRHEWISCLLLKAFICLDDDVSDTPWLTRLMQGEWDEPSLLKTRFETIKRPLADLPDTAKLIAWLVLTHHRLPVNLADLKENSSSSTLDSLLRLIDENWSYANTAAGSANECWQFPNGLLADCKPWLSQLRRWSRKLLELQPLIATTIADGTFRLVLHHARLCLMLGDHYYSSLDLQASGPWKAASKLIANTQKDKNPKQALDQHLVGVYEHTKKNVARLPYIESQLAGSYNTAQIRRKSPPAFSWQDKAAQKIDAWRKTTENTRSGFFAVNMASTGCGKTFANAKVMMSLSETGDSLRYILALGLRTLTLQTGDEYRERIFTNSDGSDLAVIIGSKAVAELHNSHKQSEHGEPDFNGSESSVSLTAESDEVVFEQELPGEGLDTILRSVKDKKLLYAPVLACTIDHIIAATETKRGGRYILPALRLLSSDLVIDEIDDFTDADLIAIGRLIHLAGMLGRKVMISSATIPPALAEGYFNTYREGWLLFCGARDASRTLGCAWVDEFGTCVEVIDADKSPDDVYRQLHAAFVEKRVSKLLGVTPRRKANIVDCSLAITPTEELAKKQTWFYAIANACEEKHRQHHSPDPITGLKVSFGVVRIANINPCVEACKYLMHHPWSSDVAVRVMAYHSRQVLLLRHEQERHLDAVLKRKEKHGEQPQAFRNTVIRQHLDSLSCEEPAPQNVLFILVATPVEEIGRDHDFDWAIIEPSSYRSIIQMAGRVNRHRNKEPKTPNIGILQFNLRTLKHGDSNNKTLFYRPGYETGAQLYSNDGVKRRAFMKCHDLKQVVDSQAISIRLDAIPRIQKNPETGGSKLANLEHAVIESQLTYYSDEFPNILQGYLKGFWWLTAIPLVFNRFRSSAKTTQLYRVFDSEGNVYFTERNAGGEFEKTVHGNFPNQNAAYNIEESTLDDVEESQLWLTRDYTECLLTCATEKNDDVEAAALRFGELTLESYHLENNVIFTYNDQLGLFKKEENYD